MLMKVDDCTCCGEEFAFDSSKCSQIILKQGSSDSLIIFLPKCPYCKSMNQIELPWNKYEIIDY